MDKWAHIRNISGMDIYVNFIDHLILEITSVKPDTESFTNLPLHFSYLNDFLTDHTTQPFLLEAIDDLDLSWATEFETAVYKALAAVPCGTVLTYGELASLIGKPKAARAVGTVMSKNRFLIVLPCHRIVASGGKIGGFSSGIENKIKLLKAEGKDVS